MNWRVRSSNMMLIAGLAFIVAGFVEMNFFFSMFSPSARIVMWLWAVLIMITFGLGFFSIIDVKVGGALAALAALFCYSLVFLVPVPAGYEETYYGGVGVLIMAVLAIHVKLKQSKKEAKKG